MTNHELNELDQFNHFIFDFVNEQERVEKLFFKDPIKTIVVSSIGQIPAALEEIEYYTKQGKYAAGYISYEAAPAFDPKMKVNANPKLPLLYFGIYDKPTSLSSSQVSRGMNIEKIKWQSHTFKEEYKAGIDSIKEHIAKGDTYQVNYTLRLQGHSSNSYNSYNYYEQLKQAQCANYSAYLNIGRYKILSLSPELFFELKAGKYMKTKPMKGTIRRGVTLEDDLYNKDKLKHSMKDQAENVMIVDLLRNDLSKISKPNTVKVPHQFVIEKYPTVYQMTSTVTSELHEDINLFHIFKALFPCGSITGAPKLKTMEIITELEKEPREVYCGSIGFITPEGDAIFNVAIRTVILDEERKQAVYGVGGGITWDSKVGDEYQEAFDKAAVLSQPSMSFELMETMRVDEKHQRVFVVAERAEQYGRHLERIEASAQYFDIPFNKEQVIQALDQYIEKVTENTNDVGGDINFVEDAKVKADLELNNGSVFRLNLFLNQQGEYRFKHQPFTFNNQGQLQKVSLAKRSVFSSNPFLYHKTTYREVYNEHRNEMGDHLFDVLLWNERGELTEFTIGNLVVKQDGVSLTPPVSSGLLAGTFRASLLEQGKIQEKVLYKEELSQFEEIWLINSLRGWVQVKLV
jgi:para-aminobenzoate synthetase/4-amino-4-deoxychorismate lyase